MPFVNPLDLLGIPPSAPAPDADTLRKATRAKLLQFDLADSGAIEHEGQPVTRADFQRACEDLDDPQKLAGYRSLQRLPALSAFLRGGPPEHVEDPLPEWALHPSFVGLVGRPFVERVGPALAAALRQKDAAAVQALAAHPPLVPDALTPDLYAETDRVLAEIVRDLKEVERWVAQPEHEYQELRADREAAALVDVETLNELPPHFEGGRSRVAQALRDLSIAALNCLDDVDASRHLIREAARLRTNPTAADGIRRDAAQIEAIYDHRELADQHAPALEAAAAALVRLQALAEAAAWKDADLVTIRAGVEGVLEAEHLNALPDAVSGPREAAALALQALALTAWNEHGDGDTALALTRLALALRVTDETRGRLEEDLAALARLARDAEAQAHQEYLALLGVLQDVQYETRGGFSGPSVNWEAVEALLDSVLDQGGLRLLRTLKDPEARGYIEATFSALLARLRVQRPDGADRIAYRIAVARPAAYRTPANRPVAPPPLAAPGLASGCAPRPVTAAPPASSDDGRNGCMVLGMLGVIGLLIAVAFSDTETTVPPPPVPLGDTMRVVVSAATGPLSPIYATEGEHTRTSFWIEQGYARAFAVADSLILEENLLNAAVTVNGFPYPTAPLDARGRLVITRASVLTAMTASGGYGTGAAAALGTGAPPSPYAGNQLADGDSPYDAYFGPGAYSREMNLITFHNGQGADAVVLLVDQATGRTVRNEYVRAGADFEMSNVASGTYFIRAFYGRDWNPTLPLAGGQITGGFETDPSFSESRYDPITLTDDGDTYSTYDITLYTVPDGNMESSTIDAADFFE